jgi:RNA polymerase sigma factor (sigma-70 family)
MWHLGGVGEGSTDRTSTTGVARQVSVLIGQVANGDERALKDLFERTSPKLFGICLRILNDKQDAEDALQDVFVSVWRRAASFDASRSSPITWLATIAKNRAIDRLRSSQRHRSTVPVEDGFEVADTAADAFQVAALAQEGERLRNCMDKLEAQHCGAIRDAFFDGLAYSQLAERAGVPLGTMKSWIRRGLQSLKKCLES